MTLALELAAELKEARATIDELRAEVARLRATLAGHPSADRTPYENLHYHAEAVHRFRQAIAEDNGGSDWCPPRGLPRPGLRAL